MWIPEPDFHNFQHFQLNFYIVFYKSPNQRLPHQALPPATNFQSPFFPDAPNRRYFSIFIGYCPWTGLTYAEFIRDCDIWLNNAFSPDRLKHPDTVKAHETVTNAREIHIPYNIFLFRQFWS